MALNADNHHSCYCCQRVASTSGMDIDSALNELGMLSSVTESRKQYLQERKGVGYDSAYSRYRRLHTKSECLPVTSSSSLPFHLLQIDTKYVTGLSGASPGGSKTETKDTNVGLNQSTSTSSTSSGTAIPSFSDVLLDDHKLLYRNPPDNLQSSFDTSHRMRLLKNKRQDISARNRRLLARKRAKQPYEVPWRLTQSFQELMLSQTTDVPESKSNNSSPVKPVNAVTLPRSRSLDNIDYSSFFINESPSDRQDIDSVATGIKNMDVTDLDES